MCFLGNRSLSTDDLASYRGPKPQHRAASREELGEAATWIRQRSEQLYEECLDGGVVYIDVGKVGFDTAMIEARRQLLGRSSAAPPLGVPYNYRMIRFPEIVLSLCLATQSRCSMKRQSNTSGSSCESRCCEIRTKLPSPSCGLPFSDCLQISAPMLMSSRP